MGKRERLALAVICVLLLAGYKRRLRRIVEAAPDWVSEEILSASEHIGE